jgi:hypothetical protein
LSVLWGWPVKAPFGHRRLPREGRVLKAVNSDTVNRLHQEADRLRLGLGKDSPWQRAHVDPDATHYLFPDPASWYWPSKKIRWWECQLLLQKIDGEQVRDSLAVLPETFAALPSNVPCRRQRRLVLIARSIERDSYLWAQDHKPHCSPEQCGYGPAEDEPPS